MGVANVAIPSGRNYKDHYFVEECSIQYDSNKGGSILSYLIPSGMDKYVTPTLPKAPS